MSCMLRWVCYLSTRYKNSGIFRDCNPEDFQYLVFFPTVVSVKSLNEQMPLLYILGEIFSFIWLLSKIVALL